MFEGSEREERDVTAPGTPESGDQAAGGKPEDEASGGAGGEGEATPGANKEAATEKIGEQGEKGQTQVPAPDDDVGGAADEDHHTH